ncbi:MAG: hypothetical protein DCC56_04325 [Anaerolineae bacterium]|nr:MAG: hypothetical protein DCC56_04325 [Anaerolineae bacterium]WKZ43925.1 MAG: hypothetical protein QY302_17650 [Anaerolineales bacterium]
MAYALAGPSVAAGTKALVNLVSKIVNVNQATVTIIVSALEVEGAVFSVQAPSTAPLDQQEEQHKFLLGKIVRSVFHHFRDRRNFKGHAVIGTTRLRNVEIGLWSRGDAGRDQSIRRI